MVEVVGALLLPVALVVTGEFGEAVVLGEELSARELVVDPPLNKESRVATLLDGEISPSDDDEQAPMREAEMITTKTLDCQNLDFTRVTGIKRETCEVEKGSIANFPLTLPQAVICIIQSNHCWSSRKSGLD